MSNNPKKTLVDMNKFWENVNKNSKKTTQINKHSKIKPSVTILNESYNISNKDNEQ